MTSAFLTLWKLLNYYLMLNLPTTFFFFFPFPGKKKHVQFLLFTKQTVSFFIFIFFFFLKFYLFFYFLNFKILKSHISLNKIQEVQKKKNRIGTSNTNCNTFLIPNILKLLPIIVTVRYTSFAQNFYSSLAYQFIIYLESCIFITPNLYFY